MPSDHDQNHCGDNVNSEIEIVRECSSLHRNDTAVSVSSSSSSSRLGGNLDLSRMIVMTVMLTVEMEALRVTGIGHRWDCVSGCRNRFVYMDWDVRSAMDQSGRVS